MDLMAGYMDSRMDTALDLALAERYQVVTGSVSALLGQILAFVFDADAFHSLFYSLPGDELCMDPTTSSLDFSTTLKPRCRDSRAILACDHVIKEMLYENHGIKSIEQYMSKKQLLACEAGGANAVALIQATQHPAVGYVVYSQEQHVPRKKRLAAQYRWWGCPSSENRNSVVTIYSAEHLQQSLEELMIGP